MHASCPTHRNAGKGAHLAPILCTIAALLVCWLAFDYINERDLAQRKANEGAAQRDTPAATAGLAAPHSIDMPRSATSPSQPEPVAQHPSEGHVFKCMVNGKVIYADVPCSEGANLREVSVAPAAQGIAPLRSYKKQLDALEQSNRNEVTSVSKSSPQLAKPAQNDLCKALEQRIRSFDDLLRMPHSAPEGDYLASEKRRMQSEWFSRCKA